MPRWIALLALATVLVTVRAAVADPPCGADVVAWVRHASEAMHTPAHPVACYPGRLRMRLQPANAQPLDVEVAEGPGPAFRRAGSLRLSPIVDADYRALPLGQREAFERLIAWAETQAHPDILVGASHSTLLPPVASIPRGQRVPWLLFAAFALTFFGLRGQPPVPTVDRRDALLIAVVATLLRALLGAWAPMHNNGQGPLWILAAAYDPSLVSAYGPGYPEVMGLAARAFAHVPDTAVFTVNIALSALTCVGGFALTRLVGLPRAHSLIVAAVVVCDPVSVWIAATEGYFTPVVALTVAASVVAVVAARSSRWSRVVLALAAGCLAAQAARIHPIAWMPAFLAPAAAFASPAWTRPREQLEGGTLITMVAWVVIVVTSARDGLAVYATVHALGLSANSWSMSWTRGLPLLSFFVVLAVVRRPRAVGVYALPVVLTWLVSRSNYTIGALWQGSYDLVYRVVPLIALVRVVPAPLTVRAGVASALGAVVLLAFIGLHAQPRRTTQQLEYVWLRPWLRELPQGCRVGYVATARRHVQWLPSYLTPDGSRAFFQRISVGNDGAPSALPPSGVCSYYVHTSLCATDEGDPACARVERDLHLTPVTFIDLAAAPDSDMTAYVHPRVHVEIDRVGAP